MDSNFQQRLDDAIRRNMGNPAFRTEDLVRELEMSHSSLLRRVRATRGKSITQVIREARLNAARSMISEEGILISEVAARLGFRSASYFTACFHEFFGFPPVDVRHHKKGTAETDPDVLHPDPVSAAPSKAYSMKQVFSYLSHLFKGRRGFSIS